MPHELNNKQLTNGVAEYNSAVIASAVQNPDYTF